MAFWRRHKPIDEQVVAVRLAVYRLLIETGRAPDLSTLARHAALDEATVAAALIRLHDEHMLVLTPDLRRVRMAMPFSAVPTLFRVVTASRAYWANCMWDALGIAALLDQDVRVETTCGGSSEPLAVEVRPVAAPPSDALPAALDQVQSGEVGGRVVHGAPGLVHVALPARQWWDDIVFT